MSVVQRTQEAESVAFGERATAHLCNSTKQISVVRLAATTWRLTSNHLCALVNSPEQDAQHAQLPHSAQSVIAQPTSHRVKLDLVAPVQLCAAPHLEILAYVVACALVVATV
mgnify:CR=1 FL=1